MTTKLVEMVYYKKKSFRIALFTQIPRSDYTPAAILDAIFFIIN